MPAKKPAGTAKPKAAAQATSGQTIAVERNLTLEAVRVTEAAALAAARLAGLGDEIAADQAAVDAMRKALNQLHIAGTIVIGRSAERRVGNEWVSTCVSRGMPAHAQKHVKHKEQPTHTRKT